MRQASTNSAAQPTPQHGQGRRSTSSSRCRRRPRRPAVPDEAQTTSSPAPGRRPSSHQSRRAIRPTRRLPAASWAEPGTTRVISHQGDGPTEAHPGGRRRLARGRWAGRGSCTGRGGERGAGIRGGLSAVRCCGSNREGQCCSPVSPVTPATGQDAPRPRTPPEPPDHCAPESDACRLGGRTCRTSGTTGRRARAGRPAARRVAARTVASPPWQIVRRVVGPATARTTPGRSTTGCYGAARPGRAASPDPGRAARARPGAAEARRDPRDAHPAAPSRRPRGPPPSAPGRLPRRWPPAPGRRAPGRGPRPRLADPAAVASCCCWCRWVVYLVVVPFHAWTRSTKVAWEPDGERPGDQPGTTYLLVGSDSRAGLTRGASASARHRQRREASAPTRSCCCTPASGPNAADVDPPRLHRRHPGPRHGQDQRRLRLRRAELLARTIESDTGDPRRRLRRDRPRRRGRGGRRRRRHHGLPDVRMVDKDAGLKIKKGCQEVDGTRRWPTPGRARPSASATSTGSSTSARSSRRSASKVLSPWTVVNPFRWWRPEQRGARLLRLRRRHEHRRRRPVGHGDGPRHGDGGKTCTMPVTDASATTGTTSGPARCSKAIINDDTDQITADQCTPAGIVGAR